MSQRILIWRYGAYGDCLYLLPVIDRLRAQGNILYLHTGFKGREIYDADTRFEGMTFYEPFLNNIPPQVVMDEDVERFKPDVVFNFANTIETSLIPRRGDKNFDWPIEHRRNACIDETFYSLPLKIAGFDPMSPGEGNCGTVAFYESEIAWAEKIREQFRDRFLVLMALAGSTIQKRFPQAASIAGKIVTRYKDAVVCIVSDPATIAARRPEFHAIGSDRILVADPRGVMPFRKSLLLARYADYVIGPETGLLVGAGMWGTPKTMLCTTCSVLQATREHRNDLSMQAKITCSPCMRAIYEPEDCYRKVLEDGRTACNDCFDEGDILDRVHLVHGKLRYLSDSNVEGRTQPLSVPEVWIDDARCDRPPGHPIRKGLLQKIC